MIRGRSSFALAFCFALLFLPIAAQEPPGDDDAIETTLVTGEVVEVDVEAGVIVVHVEAIEDHEVEHFDLDVWIDEETVLENESDWKVEGPGDLEGTLVDVEGFMDGDLFVADYVWIVEGPVEDEAPVDTASVLYSVDGRRATT